MNNYDQATLMKQAQVIRLLICDVDGVLTSGHISLQGDDEHKLFHVHDGMGFQLLQRAGIERAIISSHRSSCVEKRMQDLNVPYVFQGISNKLACYEQLLQQVGIDEHEVCYVGDDLADLAVLTRVGLSVAVADANPSILPHVKFMTQRRGGCGAVREICDLILHAQQQLEPLVHQYL